MTTMKIANAMAATTKPFAKPAKEVLAELLELKWVEEAKEINGGYAVKTKEHMFRIEMTHAIREGNSSFDNHFTQGTRFAEPVMLDLPAYWITLPDPRQSYFKFNLAEKPNIAVEDNLFGMTPQYNQLTEQKGWDKPLTPCYGMGSGPASSTEDYRNAKDWSECALAAAVYLQAAIPHYNQSWYTTAYAYRLGLVGDEYLETVPKPVATTTEIKPTT